MAEYTLSTAQSQDGSDSENSPFIVPQINLPKGGGAIRGIGEKFAANAATGTGSLTVPIILSSGRNGFGPQMSLTYDSGSGNGPFGIGWTLGLPCITLKTDRGLPRYPHSTGLPGYRDTRGLTRHRDSEEWDVFILSGAEDLVPKIKQANHDEWLQDEFERDGCRVKRYLPRIEGLFSRIERWTRQDNGDVYWRSISKDNILTVYGRTANSRISDPRDPSHIFSWLICESYDDKGNAVQYEYVAENEAGVGTEKSNERNRVRSANRYLKRIHYGNRQPLLLDVNLPGFRKSYVLPGELENADWMFEVVFDYGDSDYIEQEPDNEGCRWVRASPHAGLGSNWPVRKDPFSNYRSGFEIRTYRLCRRVLMFHHFPEELGTQDYLVRSTEFEFNERPLGSFISSVVQSGYCLHADGRYRKKSMPALELAYTSSPLEDPNFHAYDVRYAAAENLPEGIYGDTYHWIDLDGEGISGVLTEQGGTWFYNPNAGHARFRPLEVVSPQPSLAELNKGKQQLLDLAGDGNLDLVQLSLPIQGFYERTPEQGWGRFRPFGSLPILDWQDPNLRFVDLNGDGIADVLITQDDAFTWHPSFLEEGFGEAMRVSIPGNEREGPHVVFADGTQSIYLADMSGDGLSDIVRIRNGEVCYWPNIGYGAFGRKVTMDNPPWFDDSDLFDQKRIKLADMDGSGTTDILYLGRDGIKIFLNQAGNGWSSARELPQFAAASDQTAVSVVDLLGRGTMCLLWSSSLPFDAQRSLRYVDLMNGQKPHLLTHTRNNLGAETRIDYASSTEFYLADKAAGVPWVTRLPFPVHVVKRIETYDYISRNHFVSSYTYHHGFFDGVEREFRGFGRVDQLDTEDFATLSKGTHFPVGENTKSESNAPPVLTRTWFHTGVYLGDGRVSRHMEHEFWREPGLSPSEQQAMCLRDTILPEDLSPEEAREACRSLKGSRLREEIYALDDREESPRPYTVAESNYTIRVVQPRGRDLHAVFFTHPRESISFNYERKLYEIEGTRRADPRVSHKLNLEIDDFGNILKSVNVGYGRRFLSRSVPLTEADHQKQSKILLTLTRNLYTNAANQLDAHRTPLPSETRTYELIQITPAVRHFGITNLFGFDELVAKVAEAGDGRHDLPYDDINAKGAIPGEPYRRLLKSSRMLYRSNALDRTLPLGIVEALALPGENYKLAFNPSLLASVYRRATGDQPPEDLLPNAAFVLHDEAGYVDLDKNGHWWTHSGRVFYSPNVADGSGEELAQAKQHFFLPVRFHDPFGNISTIGYDVHDLAPVKSQDPTGNTMHAVSEYRVLLPTLITDANGNRSQVAFDALGMVAGMAVMGKKEENEGDTLEGFVADLPESAVVAHIQYPLHDPWQILQGATTRMVYDLFAFARNRNHAQPSPSVAYTLTRETHVSNLKRGGQTKVQHLFSYSDGFSREIQKKMQAEPEPLVDRASRTNPRWIGTGWTIFNNKGKPVRQYEPFFSGTHHFEFAMIAGVSPIIFYDPLERPVGTLHPNHTYEKVVVEPWLQETWDVNDTVTQTEPVSDPTVGSFFGLLPSSDYLPTWFEQRVGRGKGLEEKASAEKAAAHAGTPAITHFDALGRVILMVANNGLDSSGNPLRYETRIALDVEGNQCAITDSKKRLAMRYQYEMLGRRIAQSSPDAGQRWTLHDCSDKPLYSWDSRAHTFHTEYDELRRPLRSFVVEANSKQPSRRKCLELLIYGDSISPGLDPTQILQANLRTRLYKHYDTAGVTTAESYDFKGNLRRSTRKLTQNYKECPDWTQNPALELESFISAIQYDALNRPIQSILPHSDRVDSEINILQPQYNENNLLERLDLWLGHRVEPSELLDTASASLHAIDQIEYNAKAQRTRILYGNNVTTEYVYDPLTFRLVRLKTTDPNSTRAASSPKEARDGKPSLVLQDLFYTYDPVGNITSVQDDAQQEIYFRGQVVQPRCDYTYDPIYRLTRATGREHIGQLAPHDSEQQDRFYANALHPNDGSAVRRYVEQYCYDAVGNFERLEHHADKDHWTRTYTYSEASRLQGQHHSNQLTGTTVGANRDVYKYDAHGNMTFASHLAVMEWDSRDQLIASSRQVVDPNLSIPSRPEMTYYVYAGDGQRVRKVTESQSGTRKQERIYLAGFEVFRSFNSDGLSIDLGRDTLHVMDDTQRVALVERRIIGDDGSPAQLSRYQFANHLGSCLLELDERGTVISYEEYYPYGSTSYQAVNKKIRAAVKRYRYMAKERDEETEFMYYGARYYMAWIGRWISADPKTLFPPALATPSQRRAGVRDHAADNPSAEPQPSEKSQRGDGSGSQSEAANKNASRIPIIADDFNSYLFVLDNPLINADPNGEAPTQIGYVYVIRGTIDGNPVVYTGSTAQALKARFSSHEWKTLIQSESTTIEAYSIKAELNIAASGQGTLRSATNEALRSAEQVVLKRRRAEVGLEELNASEAAEEANIVKWGEAQNVTLGARFTFKAAGGVAVFAGFQLLQIFLMYRDMKLSQYVMAPYLLEDTQGVFTLQEQDRGIFRSNKYFKNYETGPLAGQRVEITGDEFSALRREGEALWGTTDWKGDWVPGLLRRELPVIDVPVGGPWTALPSSNAGARLA